ncbi:unnamed protein product [Pleuronectes platessa]|uniref:Uncharacterized protein n=1 Tax=Pleuronectes platessa TaxID=8262 RepID=A0A9N7TV35_PLEPL|nr:unnamed protein product [Pleuronectes platessa]
MSVSMWASYLLPVPLSHTALSPLVIRLHLLTSLRSGDTWIGADEYVCVTFYKQRPIFPLPLCSFGNEADGRGMIDREARCDQGCQAFCSRSPWSPLHILQLPVGSHQTGKQALGDRLLAMLLHRLPVEITAEKNVTEPNEHMERVVHSLTGHVENVGPKQRLLEEDVLQMLVSSNDAVKALSSCVEQISVRGWGLNPGASLTERHPGLLQPDSQSVCTDAPRWSTLTLSVAYLEAFATSTSNTPRKADHPQRTHEKILQV